MKRFLTTALLLVIAAPVHNHAFSLVPSPPCSRVSMKATPSSGAGDGDGKSMDDQMKEILEQEAMNPDNLKASAEQLKNMKPSDVDAILKDMDNMPQFQKDQLKSMGMDPDVMKKTMGMMRDNPQMMSQMGELMEKMSPEELVEQSKRAQQQIKDMSTISSTTTTDAGAPTTATTTTSSSKLAPVVTDAEIVDEDEDDDDDEEEEDDDDEDEDDEPIEPDADVLDDMFKVGEIMSMPSDKDKGGVTFAGFCTLPPIALLTGKGPDDTSRAELSEYWQKASLGATRVDRQGLERVWREVQENYYQDIVEEARERTLKKRKKKRGATKAAAPAAAPAAPPLPSDMPVVGSSISPDLLQSQLKNMKDEDLVGMFDQMSQMGPEEEARLRAMGADPAMLKKSAAMMKNNPLLRKAATMMMKNTPPDQLMKASQEAQQRMANMSEEEKRTIMENMDKESKK